MKKLFLIDAYAIIFRAHYAFINNPMTNHHGRNISALFGFMRYLGDIISKEKPDYLAVAFDPKGGSFRREIYSDYKANRPSTPEAILENTPIIKEVLQAMRIPIYEVAGYEADDVIGTLGDKAAKREGLQTYMVTPDKDYGQLLQANLFQYKPPKKGNSSPEIVSAETLMENYGIASAELFADILAIWGDASDNVPGVPGIGEKGATSLVSRFGDIENIIAHSSELTPKQSRSVEEHQEQLRLAKRLVTIARDVPVELNLEEMERKEGDYVRLAELYREHGLRSMLVALETKMGVQANSNPSINTQSSSQGEGSPKTPSKARNTPIGQLSLFDLAGEPAANAHVVREMAQEAMEADHGADLGGADYTNIHNTPHTYKAIESTQELVGLIEKIQEKGIFCFDTETTSLEAMRARLVGVSIATEAHGAYWIDAKAEYMEMLKPILEDKNIAKIGQNLKYDMLVLRGVGIKVSGELFDTMLMHYLLNPDARHSMDHIARSLLNYEPIPIESLIGKGARQITIDQAPRELLVDYACEDADVTFRIYEILLKKLTTAGSLELYHTIEEPLVEVLVEMEYQGAHIDLNILGSSRESLNTRLSALQTEILAHSPNPALNLNSPKQLGELLFEHLKIAEKPKKSKTGSYKTDEETLQALKDRHPIVEQILEYRGLKKLLTTYIDALPELVNPTTGVIHTSYNQSVTATGRLSSSNPNLQNIPVRNDNGREIRKAFTPREKGWKIVAADYSQVELRIMAHLSGDSNMIEAFEQGADIHTATAAKIFGKSTSEVTSSERRAAKTANFGIIYGISAFGLSQRLGIPRNEAKALIDDYFTHFPAVKNYMDAAIHSARENGYVETIFTRRRFLADINSSNSISRSFAERNAINAPIQGSAADIMKLAMRRVYDRLIQDGYSSRLVMQVHDELVLEVPPSEIEAVSMLLVEALSGAAALSVPLDVEVGIGDNWLDAH